MNNGTVRVLMGSTVMLGTGVNAQRRAVAIHHFDIPWKPSEMEQRNGRVSRPGNIIAKEFADNKVDCFIYATERTLDIYKFNILQNKQAFITQMKRGSLNLRTIDEGMSEEGGTMNFAEYVALMSGNNDLLEKARLEKIILGLENERKAFNKNRSQTENRLNRTQSLLKTEKIQLAGFLDDWNYFNEAAPENENGKRPNPVILDNFQPTSTKDVGNRLIELKRKMYTVGHTVKIGKLFRFDLAVRTFNDHNDERYNLFYIIGKNNHEYAHNHGYLAETPETAVRHFISALERLPRLIEQSENHIERMETDIPVLEKILKTTWNNSPKLQKLKADLDALDRKISVSLNQINDQINE